MKWILFIVGLIFIQEGLTCDQSDTTWSNFNSKIVNVEPENAVVKHQVGGSVKIISGCSFLVRNMTIIPTGNSAYWYGIPVHNGSDDTYPRVVASALGSYNGQSITFNLDPQYSFSNISIMEIRSEDDNRAYGAFPINGKISEHYGSNHKGDLNQDPTQPWVSSGTKLRIPHIWNFLYRSIFFRY